MQIHTLFIIAIMIFLQALIAPADCSLTPDWTVKIVGDDLLLLPENEPVAIAGNGSIIAGAVDTSIIGISRAGTILWNHPRKDSCKKIILSYDGSRTVLVSKNNTLVYLDDTGHPLWSRILPDSISQIAMSRDDDSVFTGGEAIWPGTGGNISRYLRNGTLQWNYQAPAMITDLAVSDGAGFVAAGGVRGAGTMDQPDKDLFFLDGDGRVLWSTGTGGDNCVAIDQQGTSIAVGVKGRNMIRLYNHEGTVLFSVPVSADITDVAISPDGDYLFAGLAQPVNGEEFPRIICLNRKGSLVWKYPVNPGMPGASFIRKIDIAKTTPVIVAGSSSGNVSLLGFNGTVIGNYNTGTWIEDIGISDDGTAVAVRIPDSVIRISQKNPAENVTGKQDQDNSNFPIQPKKSPAIHEPPAAPSGKTAPVPVTIPIIALGLLSIALLWRKDG
ncbi:MAG: PQQ-binding-like beta-propeller repeat protein [Methanomicrobiales archaeon]|nr:PQQ-binding-like beta-propeller repeat protein [Methanomicrobiales archaeon]